MLGRALEFSQRAGTGRLVNMPRTYLSQHRHIRNEKQSPLLQVSPNQNRFIYQKSFHTRLIPGRHTQHLDPSNRPRLTSNVHAYGASQSRLLCPQIIIREGVSILAKLVLMN